MNTKLIVKRVGLVLLLIFFFCAGYYTSALNEFWKSISLPHNESETKARSRICVSLPLPENATRLYFAHRGFLDADIYMAFSLPSPEECEQFIEKILGLKLENFEEVSDLPDFFTEFSPDTWSQEYQDPLWDLSEQETCFLCTTDRLIIYAPERNRFYYHR